MNEAQYSTLTERCGWLALSGWTQLAMTGGDRVSFLQGTCTNDVRALSAGRGCEAFVTTADGKTLGHIFVFATDDRFEIVTVPGQAETLLKHWDRYIIREDVKLHDVTNERTLLLVAGRESPHKIQALFDSQDLAELLHHQASGATSIRRMEIDPPVFWLSVAGGDLPGMIRQFAESGIATCSEDTWEMLRIELGWPFFGRDITAKNLPQEVGRDRRAISFQKGCYLGQETVARIDALGHVNWKLMGLKLPPQTSVEPDAAIEVDGKVVARITSIAFSPHLQAPVALAYVRRGWDQPGRRLHDAEVLSLPMR